MIDQALLKILACPQCHSGLKKTKNKLACQSCGQSYPIKRGIPFLFFGKRSEDVKLSKTKWEKIHKIDDQVFNLDLTKDKTLKSYYKNLKKYEYLYQDGLFLDLGCGVAKASCLLAKEKARVVGLDLASSSLFISQKLFKKENVSGYFVGSSILHLPFKENSFSFIYSCMSLEYFEETLKALRETYRVLKPGGVLYAIVPAISLTTLTYHQLRGDIPEIPLIKQLMKFIHFKIFKGKFMHYGYEKSFMPREFKKKLKQAGFGKIRFGFYDSYYPLEFIPLKRWRIFFQKLLRFRLFWPLVYFKATK